MHRTIIRRHKRKGKTVRKHKRKTKGRKKFKRAKKRGIFTRRQTINPTEAELDFLRDTFNLEPEEIPLEEAEAAIEERREFIASEPLDIPKEKLKELEEEDPEGFKLYGHLLR